MLSEAGHDEEITYTDIGTFPSFFPKLFSEFSPSDPKVFEETRAWIPVTKQRRFDVYPDVSVQ